MPLFCPTPVPPDGRGARPQRGPGAVRVREGPGPRRPPHRACFSTLPCGWQSSGTLGGLTHLVPPAPSN